MGDGSAGINEEPGIFRAFRYSRKAGVIRGHGVSDDSGFEHGKPGMEILSPGSALSALNLFRQQDAKETIGIQLIL